MMPSLDPRKPQQSADDPSQASWLQEASGPLDPGLLSGSSLGGTSTSASLLRRDTLVELVKTDLRRKWRSGNRVAVESYIEILPELGTRESIPADLILIEYEERLHSGMAADLADFAARFPHQAGKLKQLAEQSAGHAGGPGSVLLPEPDAPSRQLPPSLNLPAVVPVRLPRQFGRYRILKQLGRGSMGTVYLALDTHLDRRVAMKVPHLLPGGAGAAVDPENLARFHREVRAAATLHHPNLCPVYDEGEIEGILYLTMAYIKGRPLSSLIKRDRPLPLRWIAAAIRKLALAMEEAHAQGVVHRDLKPSNIMVASRRHLVIMDFGLAWRVGCEEARLTRTGTILGTPAYMAPEQLTAVTEDIGPRCDVYSLGVILYELLTGRRPFEGPTAAVLAKILYADPEPPSKLRADLDPQLEAICLRAMARDPEHRFASMADLAAEVGRYLRQQAPPSSGPAPMAAPVIEPAEGDSAADSSADTDLPSSLLTHDLGPAPETCGTSLSPAGGELVGVEGPPAQRDRPAWPPHFEEAQPEISPERGATAQTAAPEGGGQSELLRLKRQWRAWTAVVEMLALLRPERRRVSSEGYATLHAELMSLCRSRIGSSEPADRLLYEKLHSLAEPWLTLQSLADLDRETLIDLLIRCRQAELELHGQNQAAEAFVDKVRSNRASATRSLSVEARMWLAVGSILCLVAILTLIVLANWRPDWFFTAPLD